MHDHFDHVLLPKTEDLVLFENKEGKLLIFGHRRIQGGAKGARAHLVGLRQKQSNQPVFD